METRQMKPYFLYVFKALSACDIVFLFANSQSLFSCSLLYSWFWYARYLQFWTKTIDSDYPSLFSRKTPRGQLKSILCLSRQGSLMDLEYSFNWPRNDEKVIWLWRHLVVFNSETADGKSSTLTTGPLIHNHDDAILATHYFLDFLNWQNFIYVK